MDRTDTRQADGVITCSFPVAKCARRQVFLTDRFCKGHCPPEFLFESDCLRSRLGSTNAFQVQCILHLGLSYDTFAFRTYLFTALTLSYHESIVNSATLFPIATLKNPPLEDSGEQLVYSVPSWSTYSAMRFSSTLPQFFVPSSHIGECIMMTLAPLTVRGLP